MMTYKIKWRRKRDSNPRGCYTLSVFKTDPFSQAWVFLQILWWLRAESNRRHMDFQSIALPTELPSHNTY